MPSQNYPVHSSLLDTYKWNSGNVFLLVLFNALIVISPAHNVAVAWYGLCTRHASCHEGCKLRKVMIDCQIPRLAARNLCSRWTLLSVPDFPHFRYFLLGHPCDWEGHDGNLVPHLTWCPGWLPRFTLGMGCPCRLLLSDDLFFSSFVVLSFINWSLWIGSRMTGTPVRLLGSYTAALAQCIIHVRRCLHSECFLKRNLLSVMPLYVYDDKNVMLK